MTGPTYKQKASALLAQLIGDDANSELRCQFLFSAIAVYAQQTAQASVDVLRAELTEQMGMPGDLTPEKWMSIACEVSRALHNAVNPTDFRGFMNSGMTEHEAIGAMKGTGASPMEVILQLRDVCGHSLGQAKQIFAAHPAWKRSTKRADAIHRQALAALGAEVVSVPAVTSAPVGERPTNARHYRHPARKSRAGA